MIGSWGRRPNVGNRLRFLSSRKCMRRWLGLGGHHFLSETGLVPPTSSPPSTVEWPKGMWRSPQSSAPLPCSSARKAVPPGGVIHAFRPLLPLFFPYKREVVSGNPRGPVKGDNNPVIGPQEPSGNAFPGGALYSHGRPLGGGKDTRASHGPILLAGPSRERPPVVYGVSWMPVGKSTGHRQRALVSITIDGGPLRENWYGPHRAIGAFGTRIPLCIGPGGLCNAISGSSAPVLLFDSSPVWESRKRFSWIRARRLCPAR